jgi:hypothetical protein
MKTLLCLVLVLPIHAQTLGGFETFSVEENASGWGFYNYASEEAFIANWKLPDTTDAEIYGAFTQDSGVSLFADAMSSSQYFIGDYASAGIDTVICEIYVEDAASFLEAEIYILSGNVFYYSDPYGVDADGWSTLTNSFSGDQWYIYNDTDKVFIPVDLTPPILSDVTEIGVKYYPSSTAADGKLVALDNFGIFPDLTPPALTITTTKRNATIAFTGIPGIQYTVQSSNTLRENSWTNIENPFEITGPSQSTTPLSPQNFFRVRNQVFYLETP